MKTIKPNTVALLSRTFEYRRRIYLSVAPVLFFPLGGDLRLRTEAALWQFLAQEMGTEAVLDAAMPKAAPEFLVHGRVFAPDGKPAEGLAVRARLAGKEKALLVFGDRYWEGPNPSKPEPFLEMPLDWTRAFGGEGFAANPMGRGIRPANPGDRLPLPNVERADDRLLRPDQVVRPAGFGARDPMHPDRLALAGTYGDDWLKTDFPGLPSDADWRYFNVAGADQWLDAPLIGTEEWEFENLHPAQRVMRGSLPGLRARCFLVRCLGHKDRLEELPLKWDTVWFFPHSEHAVLIARGMTEVAEEEAEEIRVLVAGVEWIGENRPMQHYHDAMNNRLDPERSMYFLLKEDDLLPAGLGARYQVEAIAEPPQPVAPVLAENLNRAHREAIERARGIVAGYGLDPDAGHGPALPRVTDKPPEKLEDLPAYIAKVRAEADEAKARLEAVEKQADKERRALFASLGMDYSVIEKEISAKPKGPPAMGSKAQLESLQQLRDRLAESGGPAEELDQYLKDPGFRQRLADGERNAREGYRLMADTQDPVDAMPAVRAAWVRERALAHKAEGRSFAGIDLTGANLSGMDFSGVDFSGALLEGVDFSGARLVGCNFEKAVLARARFDGADLSRARLAAANLGKCRGKNAVFDSALLEGAILRGAEFESTRFALADLRRVELTGGMRLKGVDWSRAIASDLVWIDADLRGLSCVGANMERCVFIRCRFDGVDFSGVRFDRSVFLEGVGPGAVFRGATLSGCSFIGGTDLTAADFSGAQISATYFRPSRLAGARFDGARMSETDLSLCDLEAASFVKASAIDSRFVKANLNKVRFAAANLMNSNLQRARIEAADLRNSNLYGADLARVAVDSATRLVGALTHRVRTHPRLAREKTDNTP